MLDYSLLYYCPCCGEFAACPHPSGHCTICGTVYNTVDGITVGEYFEIPFKERDLFIQEIQNKVKNMPTFNQEMWDKRVAEENDNKFSSINIPKCPTCGSTNVSKISDANKVGSAVAFGLFSLGHISKTFKCNSCGYKW